MVMIPPPPEGCQRQPTQLEKAFEGMTVLADSEHCCIATLKAWHQEVGG